MNKILMNMGLFNFFKKEIKIQDELFGELKYEPGSKHHGGFLHGKVNFHSREIGIDMPGDETGPRKEQKDFYLNLRDTYTSFKTDVILPYLRVELEDWMTDDKFQNFDNDFQLDGISLPAVTDQPKDWSITYYSTEIDHWVTINFIDMQPQKGIIVDG